MTVQKKDFDQEAASWDENPTRVKLVEDISAAIAGQVELRPEMRAMDFGCGTGLLTMRLQPLVGAIVGIDSSKGMLEIFDRKVEQLGVAGVSSQLVDLDGGDVLTGSYDLIVSSMTLHHVKDIAPLLKQFYNVLAPGGRLCIADLDLDRGQFHGDDTGVFHDGFDREILRGSFVDVGFIDVRDVTAAEVVKKGADGRSRTFTVFLITASKE